MDDGIGINADRLKDIFNMYSQIESAQGRGSAGLGIGLALVRTLVELHGGYVDVESEGANLGSTFNSPSPFGRRPAERKRPDQGSCSTFHPIVSCFGGGRPARRYAWCRRNYLKSWDIKSQSASNGVEALEMLDSFQPACYLVRCLHAADGRTRIGAAHSHARRTWMVFGWLP